MQIYPSILAQSFEELEIKINLVRGLVDTINLDIMDGFFVNNKTIYDVDKINSFEWGVDYELHLMIKEKEIEKWLNTSAKRIIFHYESFSVTVNSLRKCQEVIKKIKAKKLVLRLIWKQILKVSFRF